MRKSIMIMTVLALAVPASVYAQGYYDDDIYYNASKADKNKNAKKGSQTLAAGGYYYVPNQSEVLPASDTYIVNSGSTRDVDEYNRRGQFLVSDTVISDSTYLDTFANTRRIERFHNQDIINNSGDTDLQAIYYSTEPATTVNIYVNNDPWYSPYWSWNRWRYSYPWYSWSWTWDLYDPFWGPSWTWGPGWGWGPSWAWGPNWGWGHGWHGWHGWGPGYPGPAWAGTNWRPNPTPAGSSRPHNYTGAGSSGGRYTGAGSAGTRPGNNGYGYAGATSRPGSTGVQSGNTRPGQGSSGTPAVGRPANTGTGVSTNGTGNVRGRSSSSSSSSSSGSYSSPARSSSSSGSYSPSRSSSSSSSSSRGSYSGGGGGGRSAGGATHSSGGGGGRGRR